MSNDFYTPSGVPATSSSGSSATMRGEFSSIGAGFDKLPGLSGNGLKAVRVNAGATALEAVAASALNNQDVAWAGDITPAQITSNQDDYNPTGLSTASTIRLSTDASRNITGLQGGSDGRMMILHNIGSFAAVLKDESGSSSAANRFALAGDLTLAPDHCCLLQYDSTSSRWRIVGLQASAFAQTILDDTSASAVRTTIGIDGASGVIASGDIASSAVSTAKIADNAVTYGKLAANVQDALNSLVELFHVDYDTGHRDLAAARYDPSFFNQQWGGAPHYFEMVDGATGTPYRFEAPTGYLDDLGTGFALASAAGNTWRYQSFKVSKDTTVARIWLVLGSKTGNPTNNLNLRIVTDNGSGKPSSTTAITNGTATAIPMKSIASGKTMVAFTFATPPSLSANTTYHFLVSSSGAVDGSNYFTISGINAKKYPHGSCGYGDATPTWTADGSDNHCYAFLIESASGSLSTGGLFSDGKYTFYEGSPLNQSNGRVKDLKDFRGLDLTDFTLLVRGTAWTKDKTILEFQYGLDHDRIVLRSNVTTGYPQIDVYESDGTKHTVTGTTDVSTGDHDILIRVRAKGDGSDAVSLYVDGSSQGTPVSSATISFDALFGLAQIGTFWIGGGFAIAPTFSGSSIGINGFSGLPSTLGWTYNGTATESSAYSVSGGKLYQNKGGFGSTDTGYYSKAASANNAVGTSFLQKMRITSNGNAVGSNSMRAVLRDGSKNFDMNPAEYFCSLSQNGGYINSAYPQFDFKTRDFVAHLLTKGSDSFAFVNGRLIFDASAVNTSASATNQLEVGDNSATAGENADAIHSYWKYYTTAWLPPQFTAGSLSELAIWTGDKTALASPLYNSGTFVSVKQYCGIRKNYLEEVESSIFLQGITSSSTTSSTSLTGMAEMEGFVIGSDIAVSHTTTAVTDQTNGQVFVGAHIDGLRKNPYGNGDVMASSYVANQWTDVVMARRKYRVNFGLHKVDIRWMVSAGTGQLLSNSRVTQIEARA